MNINLSIQSLLFAHILSHHAFIHSVVKCFSLFLWWHPPPSLITNCFPQQTRPPDKTPWYWFSLSSSYFTHSLINHKLLLSFTPSPKTHTIPHGAPSLHNSQNCTIVPCFPCPVLHPLVPFSLGFIYDTAPQPVWPPITMTTGTVNIYQGEYGPDSLNHTHGSGRYCCWCNMMCMAVIVQYTVYVHRMF